MDEDFQPAYLELHARGELTARAEQAIKALEDCRLCPRQCSVDRTAGELGFCGVGRLARIDAAAPHFGEEAPLVGEHGSGTIFLAGCNLHCVFCQNYTISQCPAKAPETPAHDFAQAMLSLQDMGCHNINFVTPSHVTAQILEALVIATDKGLQIPLVYNSSGYDDLHALEMLDGVVDIYMPDAKFMRSDVAAKFCAAPDYSVRAMEAISAMHAQVGDLALNNKGVARRGLLVRHLVMPGNLASTHEWMEFLAGLSKDTYVNIMDQYRPCHKASEFSELSRHISPEEYEAAIEAAYEAGISRLDERSPAKVLKLIERLFKNG
ncbi:radical SAM protein [Oceanidesulfovibrio indonesiensis]|uniref:Radical SAM protein n=1 Tax=Oceanidesulfovibrio indonesiensis TaxID=54767 RepID=A0A7M3MED5_9BACT|nr:radical SAM protein [Oceanidesulfovibrio indonesiensis]TVM16697.1 radical SAM protein [Oceanidesulfovibrio indonesiensis]